MVLPRKGALAEESAEVEVLFANMEKLKGLTKKIQGSMNRLESSGKSVQDAIGPIYGNTQRLQVTNSNIDKVIEAIDRVREPLDQRNREDRIIRAGPKKVGLPDYIASLDRTTQALADLKNSNLKSNQNAITELKNLVKYGTKQLEDAFREMLMEDIRVVEPLHYITKQLPFPTLPQEKLSRFRLINAHVSASVAQMSNADYRETPTAKAYADIRGDYITSCLRNLSTASVSMVRKASGGHDANYKKGSNGIGMYVQGIEGIYRAEYENICPIFARDEWGAVYTSTCQSSLLEFNKTLRELDGHIKNNVTTDCFLAYEIIELISELSIRLEQQTGELKRPMADSLKPIRETAKTSLTKLLDDTRSRTQTLPALPIDGASVPITAEVMSRLQTMTAYLSPLSSIMTSLGDGGWSSSASASSSSLKSFDVGADGRELFAHYASDTMDILLSNLESKARTLLKGKSLQGIFIANNVAIIDRTIGQSELQPLLASARPKIEHWKKKGSAMYLDAWKEPSAYLLDVQYTNRGGRPTSGGVGTDSAAVVKALSSKDKESIKEKFRNFNTSFDELMARHKSYKMEKEVRSNLSRDVQAMIEPLYGRFWDRYHEIDKGKGKYVKYDKSQLSKTLTSLA